MTPAYMDSRWTTCSTGTRLTTPSIATATDCSPPLRAKDIAGIYRPRSGSDVIRSAFDMSPSTAPEEIDITNGGRFREALLASAARGASLAAGAPPPHDDQPDGHDAGGHG